MQLWPYLVTQNQHGGTAAPIQTKAVNHSIAGSDLSSGYSNIAVVWDTPFPDANYEVFFTVEVLTNVPGNAVYATCVQWGKTATGFTAQVGNVAADLSSSTPIIVHAIAFRNPSPNA